MHITKLQLGTLLLGGIFFTGVALKPAEVSAVDLYSQNFNSLTLGPVVTFDSEIRERNAWTNVPPTGWTVDNSAVATNGNPNSGVKEFEGWTFVSKDWWITTSGGQDRNLFSNGSGIVAVADPDEWDDFPRNDPTPDELGVFDSKLTSPAISLAGVAANQAKAFFHSSWRDEDTQQATLIAKYNTGASIELLRWDSRKMLDDGMGGEIANPNFKDDAPNEGLTFNLNNPAGASSVQLEFRVFEAKNDWWWAFDNLQVFTGDAPSADGALRAVIDRESGSVRIVNRTGQAVNLRGYSLRSSAGAFEEAAANFLSTSDPNWLKATRLGDPANDLSEVHLTSGLLSDLGEINFGNVWRKFYRDSSDIRFEYLVEGSDEPVSGILQFTGHDDKAFDFLDLNYSGEVEIGDWLAFKAGFGQSLTGQPEVIRHNLGDLDNDKLHTAADFLEFEARYNSINGAGAFAQALAGVPEPGCGMLAGIAVLGFTLIRKRSALPRVACLLIVAIVIFGGATNDAHAQLKIFTEDFENLPLGPNVQETVEGEEVWTNTPPTGWTINNSGMPGFGDPATNGVDEWAGWAFAKKDWWVEVEDQGRSEFSRGQGTVMIADPDEWDDDAGQEQQMRRAIATAPTPDNLFDSFATTRVINIPAGIPAGRIKLAFDSSWLPEGFDDLDETNNQTATINVRYNNGPKIEVLHWDSDDDPENALFHEGNTNERISGLDLQYNGTSTTMQLEFGLGKAWNDWWWAIDNISVEVPADPSVVRIDTNTGRGFLVGGDVISTTLKSIDIASELGQLSGATATGLSGAGGMEKVDGPDGGGAAGDSAGEQWEKLTATDNRLFEAFLFGDSVFTESRSVDLGVIFDTTTPAVQRDIAFSYTTATGDSVVGTVEYFASAGLLGDYNNNGAVDAADYVLWRNHLGTNHPLPNQGATPGQITSHDFTVWKSHFGESIVGGGGAVGSAAVPEPATVLFVACAAAFVFLRQRSVRSTKAISMAAAVALSVVISAQSVAETLDRDYRFGNNDPGAVANGLVNTTFDSAGALGMGQLTDLTAVGGIGQQPRYIAINDRPDGVSGLGIRLNFFGGEQQYLKTGFGESLNFPERSPASIFSPGGTIDYSYVSDRGFQLWAKPAVLPAAGARFDIVMDSNQHGVSIDSAGKFVMRYAYADYASPISAVANTWFHLSVVRPFGPNNGSILYVNGKAAAAATGEYNIEFVANAEGTVIDQNKQDTSPLVVGANTGIGSAPPDDPRPPTPAAGSANYFRGIVDDLEMFVMGMNRTRDFGEYDFQFDNDYAAHFKPTHPIDLTGDSAITNADAQLFASNWLFENELKWVDPLGEDRSLIVGDLVSRTKGDFNFDGRVNLADWAMLNNASPGIGAAAMTLIQGGAIPEPSAGALALLAAIASYSVARRPSAFRRNRSMSVRNRSSCCAS